MDVHVHQTRNQETPAPVDAQRMRGNPDVVRKSDRNDAAVVPGGEDAFIVTADRKDCTLVGFDACFAIAGDQDFALTRRESRTFANEAHGNDCPARLERNEERP